jgi:exosome complex component CSL4|tara:strand:+ start:584 stop:1195 length:612 start_codon:yes stop_codon:yes gene_type:complete
MAMFLVPGDRIVPMGEGVAAGPGTYVHGSHIQSSLYGERYDITDESTGTCTITVRSIDNKSRIILPEVNDIVLCKVIRISDAYAKVQILCVRDQPLRRPVEGLIRKQDVRESEIDLVKMSESFLPGDIVKCKVISLGDRRSYFLSTSSEELGVLNATSTSGHVMEAVQHDEMIDPVTKEAEKRKVAKKSEFSLQTMVLQAGDE